MILGPGLTLPRPYFFGLVCCLFSDTSPEGSRDAFWNNFGSNLVQFGCHLGWIWARTMKWGSPFYGKFREEILQRPCTKSCSGPGQSHPQAQTLRVRRSRASVFNKNSQSSLDQDRLLEKFLDPRRLPLQVGGTGRKASPI